ISRRGHVEFLYAALKRMSDFNAHQDIETYKKLLSVFPKYKMIPKNVWQVEFMHYPKQQQCCIDILDYMESQGVVPDDDLGYQLRDLFGQNSHVFRKYRRMMFWMPKFKFQNPYYVPYELPSNHIELARMALKRMSVDLATEISVFHTEDIATSNDKTFIVSAQSPEQASILKQLPKNESLLVEGGFTVWLRSKTLTYFVLKSERNDNFLKFQADFQPHDYKQATEKREMNLYTFDKEPSEHNKSLVLPPSIHEQEDGTTLAMCLTGTSSKDSLASWIKFLERSNPSLSNIPVLLMLKSATNELEVIRKNNNNDDNM
ncbi:hypothetical protein HELRODRAFT_76513, partial [Helobdella robusta]|uniref:Evolutionarily conserved signaling intermediate in Toll pathway, mitochondrial n=1 Tax=Helobdella robusta TaxID=6412 RepID=T1G2K8_HELRO